MKAHIPLPVIEFYKLIYDIEFTMPVVAIYVDTCGCNMGYCGAVIGYEETGAYKSVNDLFCMLGQSPTYGEDDEFNDYYEYPDSVILTLEKLEELPQLTTEKGCKNANVEPKKITITPDAYYVTANYGR